MSDKTKQGILSLTIKDRTVLYAAYMPFLRNGGLFIPTNKRFTLGEEVFVLLALMDEAEKTPITGTVVRVTPKVAQGNRHAGIGVQCSEKDFAAATKIEEHLGTGLVSDRPTRTM
jgi:type IV pilus assembly protein PilZ